MVPPFPGETEENHYLHGKMLAVETDSGIWLAIGSANPSAPAWLQSDAGGNAEAVVVLSGKAARVAYRSMGLEALVAAPPLPKEALDAVSERTRAARGVEQEREQEAAPPTRFGLFDGHAVFVPGLAAADCRRTVALAEEETDVGPFPFLPAKDGVRIDTGADGRHLHLIRIDGDHGPLATVVVHVRNAIQVAVRPPKTEQLLERLGRLDELDDDIDELLDLLDRYIFADPQGVEQKRRVGTVRRGNDAGNADDAPFGPRGVSLADCIAAKDRPLLFDHDLNAIITLLIRDLDLPKAPDGDERDIDQDDRDHSDPDRVADPQEKLPEREIDWSRVATACRKRVGTMVSKLRQRLDSAHAKPGQPVTFEQARWLCGRMLTVLALLYKLRRRRPFGGGKGIDTGAARPDSLVSLDQIRTVFKTSVKALYCGEEGLARIIETSREHRVAMERGQIDGLLLWCAREIGVDADTAPGFNESQAARDKRLSDRADALLVAMSAAAHPPELARLRSHPAETVYWGDGRMPAPDWTERHLALGAKLQRAAKNDGWLPTDKRLCLLPNWQRRR
ncbi:hypothetical protein GAY28_34635, partial [Azospirillum brasilense]|nr:hypothetical protein [Azospirillum brasilense]